MAAEVLVTFSLARLIKEQAQSIKSQVECFFFVKFQLNPSSLKRLGFYVFAPGI